MNDYAYVKNHIRNRGSKTTGAYHNYTKEYLRFANKRFFSKSPAGNAGLFENALMNLFFCS